VTVLITADELSLMIRGIVAEELRPIREKILYEPDETVLPDIKAAAQLGVSVSTLRRLKASGKVPSVATPNGRVCRQCDVDECLPFYNERRNKKETRARKADKGISDSTKV
jgi:DNA-binding Xre family transcriptional regulator